MKRQLLITAGFFLLIAGWMSSFMSQAIPLQSDFYYLLPALLLGTGLGILVKQLKGARTAGVVAITALLSIVAINQLYPNGQISVSGFLQRMQMHKQQQSQPEPGTAVQLKVRDTDRSSVFAAQRTLNAYANIEVQLFSHLPGPGRMLAFDDAGRLYVSIPKLGAIYQLSDSDGDGFAKQPHLYHVGLDRPHGLVWQGDTLYVAETDRLLRLCDRNGDNQADDTEVLLDGLPDDGGHWTRSLALGADGQLYLSVGSRCNACEEPDQRRATVLQVDPLTGNSTIYARGLRNTVGLAFSADGKTLWGSDNGRDMLGDDIPPEEINRIVAGGDYGWPYCYGDQIPDPELGRAGRCAETLPPAVALQAHSAPLGITFGAGLKAPEEYRNSLYVAFHGSWNRSVPTGYKLIRIPFNNGQPEAQGREFLSGWLSEGNAWGRPVAPVVGPDGSLYLSDDRADAIYRISWKNQE